MANNDNVAVVKAAIDALNRPSETTAANKWLIQFECTPEAWVISDLLVKDSNVSYRFFGAKVLYSKLQKDYSQLDSNSTKSLLESIVQNIIRLAEAPKPDINVCRYLALGLSTLALQLNCNGIVSQMLIWLNPILNTQPIVLLELLLVLPEECYDRRVLVSTETRNLFSQQLCQSVPEVFGFLSSLQQVAPVQVKTQILKCLETWLYNISVPLSYLCSHPILQFVLESLSNPELLDQAAEVLVTCVRCYGSSSHKSNYDESSNQLLFPLLVPAVSSLISVWTKHMVKIQQCNAGAGRAQQQEQEEGEYTYEEGDMDACRSICRVLTELVEGFLKYILELQVGVHGSHPAAGHSMDVLLYSLKDCLSIPYCFEVARIPLIRMPTTRTTRRMPGRGMRVPGVGREMGIILPGRRISSRDTGTDSTSGVRRCTVPCCR